MITLFQGLETGPLNMFKGGDETVIGRLMDDNGAPLDLTGDTVTMRIYAEADRKNAAVASKAATLTTATAGHVTVSWLTADLTLAQGQYYAFFERAENIGSTTEFSRSPCTIIIK